MQRYAKAITTDGGGKYRTTLELERRLVERARARCSSISHIINDMLRSVVGCAGVAQSGQRRKVEGLVS